MKCTSEFQRRNVVLIYTNARGPRLANRLADGRKWRPAIGESEEQLRYRIALSGAGDDVRTVDIERPA